jgi:uncharacterized membrane protein SirB2
MWASDSFSFQTFACFLSPPLLASSIALSTTSSKHKRSMHKIFPHFSIAALLLQPIVVLLLFNCALQQKVEL